jgi:hypothetical protein
LDQSILEILVGIRVLDRVETILDVFGGDFSTVVCIPFLRATLECGEQVEFENLAWDIFILPLIIISLCELCVRQGKE